MNRPASTAESVLAEARAYGITLVPDGSRLRIGAPKGALTAALHAKIVGHKVELLALLRGGDGTVSRLVARIARAYSVFSRSAVPRVSVASAAPSRSVATSSKPKKRYPSQAPARARAC
jgi:hypothetical protein